MNLKLRSQTPRWKRLCKQQPREGTHCYTKIMGGGLSTGHVTSLLTFKDRIMNKHVAHKYKMLDKISRRNPPNKLRLQRAGRAIQKAKEKYN